MTLEDQYFEQIERYISGKLSAEETAQLEREIAADPSLADLVELHRLENAAIDHAIAETLRPQVQEWVDSSGSFAQSRQLKNKKWWLGLLGLGCLIAIGTIYLNMNDTPGELLTPETPSSIPEQEIAIPPDEQKKSDEPDSPQKEVPEKDKIQSDKPLNPYQVAAIERIAPPSLSDIELKSPDEELPSNDSNPLIAAKTAYTEGKYNEALYHANRIQPDHPQYDYVREMQALANFQLGKFEYAAREFLELLNKKTFGFKDRLEWNLVLCYLAQYPEKKEQFEKFLKIILEDPEHPYLKHALDLQRKMEKE